MEGCTEHERLTVPPMFTYSPPVVTVRFGHLYKGNTNQRDVQGLVWQSIVTQLPHQLVAMDPQTLGTRQLPTICTFRSRFSAAKA